MPETTVQPTTTETTTQAAPQPETIEVTQDSPEAGELDFQDYKKVRGGKPVKIAKPPAQSKTETKTEATVATEQKTETTEAKSETAAETKTETTVRKDPKKRIANLMTELYEERDRADRLEERLRQLEAGAKPAETAKATESPDPTEPKFDKAYLEKAAKEGLDYEGAVAKFTREYNAWFQAQQTQKSQANEQQQRLKEKFDAHNKRLDEAREKYDDFDEVVKTAARTVGDIPRDAALALIEMENGAEVIYHICSDHELLKSISKLSPFRAIAKVGAISEALAEKAKGASKEPTTEKKIESKAPEPITPVATSGKVTVDPGEMSPADYRKWHKATYGTAQA